MVALADVIAAIDEERADELVAWDDGDLSAVDPVLLELAAAGEMEIVAEG